MGKHNSAQRKARNLPAETDSPRNEGRQPYRNREQFDAQDYGAVLEVTTFAGRSTGEVQPRSRWLMFGDIALASEIEKQRRTKGKVSSAEFDKMLGRLNNQCIQFLKVDLELGLTMAQIAACPHSDAEKRERNRRNARKAYDAVVRFRNKVVMTAEQSRQLSHTFSQLHMALVDLGERLHPISMFA